MYILGRILTVIIAVIIAVVAIAAGYYIYLNSHYSRIGDGQKLVVNGWSFEDESDGIPSGEAPGMSSVQSGVAYKALTYNIGYGANDRNFSFFMSEGRTAIGDATKGTMSKAENEKTVKANIDAVTALVSRYAPDFALLQEVDKDAGRSYHVDEYRAITNAYAEKTHEADGAGREDVLMDTYATNFHSGFLLYPPTKPIGQIKDSGILTLSKYVIDSAKRRSLPVESGFLKKFFDLDRCFSVSYLPVEGTDMQLALINLHLSAFDEGGSVRDEQMKELADFMAKEREKGNWVIAGGDWNLCFPGSEDAFMGRMELPSWAHALDEADLPEGFRLVAASNADTIATCRDTSIPWTPGVSYETIIDGWVVSDNVTAYASNIDTDYEASDHNPVLLTFTLKE